MISKREIEDCIKNEIINKHLHGLAGTLQQYDCLPPEEGEKEFEKPMQTMLHIIKSKLEGLYDDAQRVSRFDLSVIARGKSE
jgi:hypothetical protein